MDEIEYTLEERLRSFGLGFLFGAVGLRLAEVPETITENILALHDLAVAAAGQHGFDRAASLALACAESSRGRF